MRNLPSATRPGEVYGDLLRWLQENASSNQKDLEKLQKNLGKAIQNDLTPRQKKLLLLYYYDGLSQSEIAEREGVHPSTVCRTIARAERRIQHVLKYVI